MKPFRMFGLGLLALIGLILLKPIKLNKLSSKPRPVTDYEVAIKRIEGLRARDNDDINPVCRTTFMPHGQKTDRAIIFWHGYTSCPQQFYQLGRIFHGLGYNVVIPRLPCHGLADRMSTVQAQLTAEELIALVDEVSDIAHGLGRHVAAVGFSAGGVLAGWTAQHRADIDQAIIISPVFWLKAVPGVLTWLFIKFFLTFPNFYRWWDPDLKTEELGPRHGYPRYSSRALTQILRLGLAVRTEARHTTPAASSILVITNPNDWAVDNSVTAEIVSRWRNNGSGNVQTYEFEADFGLGHDFIDPDHVNQQVDLVYPILVDLVNIED